MRCCEECAYWDLEMKYTDQTIPVECAECEVVCEGLGNMISHILEAHDDIYDVGEAMDFAQKWTEDAYPLREKELADYYRERQIEKAIDADAFPFK